QGSSRHVIAVVEESFGLGEKIGNQVGTNEITDFNEESIRIIAVGGFKDAQDAGESSTVLGGEFADCFRMRTVWATDAANEILGHSLQALIIDNARMALKLETVPTTAL